MAATIPTGIDKLINHTASTVVASPLGVSPEIVDHRVNGFLEDTPAQWNKPADTAGRW